MSGMFETIQLLMKCGLIITIAFLVALSLPNSKLRDFLMPIASGAMAILCGVYVVSPVDVVPEIALGPIGFIDDLVAIGVGFMAANRAVSGPSRDE